MAADTVERLRRLVEDLLDAGRLEQGLFTLATEEIDVAELARETARGLATAAAPAHVRAPPPMPILVDAARVRQALENLIVNAQKHTPKGVPVSVEVITVRKEDGEWAVLHVRDEGPGIAPEVMPRLFTRFGTGPGSTGLGLGLYVAHGIAKAHGGTLTVDSAPGRGASFYLSLPVQ